jgi:hypothetical protein
MSTAASFSPLAAATGEAVRLSMQRLWLTGQVLPAGARLTVQHVFRSEGRKGAGSDLFLSSSTRCGLAALPYRRRWF